MNTLIIRTIITIGLLGASVMPTAIYGLFHLDSWTYNVTRFVFSLA